MPQWLLHVDRVYRIERHTLTPTKYMFPNFEPLNWFAAQHILDTLRGSLSVYCTAVLLRLNFLPREAAMLARS